MTSASPPTPFKNEACAVRQASGSARSSRWRKLLLAAASLLLVSGQAWARDLPEIHGFVEAAYGPKFLADERTERDEFNLLEQRFQLKALWRPDQPRWLSAWNPELFYKGDLLVDEYEKSVHYKIREAYGLASPLSWMDVKCGRQILTWGTGDLIFINDVFPKDFVSFFIGRDEEYLKVPSDAAKFSVSSPWASADLVLIPFFEPDTPISGDRLSFYDTFTGRLVGKDAQRIVTEPGFQPENTEIAGRLYKTLAGYEAALYAFKGYFNQAKGIKNQTAHELFYPKLAVYGGSLRGPLPILGGIAYGEAGYYDSLENRSGKNRLIENGSMKYLAGYERDFPKDLRIGIQYFAESDLGGDHSRQLLTFRVTKLLKFQTLELSLFTFYSPTDEDAYFRPIVIWRITDHWRATVGANVFLGDHDWTEFGQLEDNDNVYARIRFSF